MKAKEGVLEFLNQVLKSELTAVHQYLLHSAMCKNWGYARLHEHFSHLATEEVGHSSGLIDHVLYLEGTPEVEHLDQVGTGRTVADLLKADLDFERDDVELLRKGIYPLFQRRRLYDSTPARTHGHRYGRAYRLVRNAATDHRTSGVSVVSGRAHVGAGIIIRSCSLDRRLVFFEAPVDSHFPDPPISSGPCAN